MESKMKQREQYKKPEPPKDINIDEVKRLMEHHQVFFNLNMTNYEEYENYMYHALLWGTYKPQCIHAITQRHVANNPITLTMVYFDPTSAKSVEGFFRSRIKDRPSSETVYNFEWHNGFDYMVHKTRDPSFNSEFLTSFIKFEATSERQKWVTFIKNARDQSSNSPQYRLFQKDRKYISFVVTLAVEAWDRADEKYLRISPENDRWEVRVCGLETESECSSEVFYVGVHVNNKRVDLLGSPHVSYQVFDIPKDETWELHSVLYDSLQLKRKTKQRFLKMFNNYEDIGDTNTLVALQFIFNTTDDYLVQVHHDSADPKAKPIFSTAQYNQLMMIRQQRYNMDFERKFPRLHKAEELQHNCARASLSCLLGGLYYAYGKIKIKEPYPEYKIVPQPLFSGTPSRLGFPRGFLWDEGFHNMITCKWSHDICMMSIKNWLDTMDDRGWVPREQIRGREAEDFVPQMFITQNPDEANPPTMMLPIMYLYSDHWTNPHVNRFLYEYYPKIRLWFEWFYNSQRVVEKGVPVNFFKWHGLLGSDMYLGSGLDDYPRHDIDGHKGEGVSKYHMDLHIWEILFVELLSKLAVDFQMEQDALFFGSLLGELKNNMKAFIDPRDNLYKDVLTTVRGETFFANHFGYITLFPLMFGHIPNGSPELEATLNLLTDHTELWCMYGIRSLSRLNRFFGKDDNYWRGPIWINMNFMILRGLKKFYSKNNKAMNAYKQLRENLIKNICSEWNTRGYFFENYDSFTGKGQRNHPFNGWTSLISLIIAEDFY